VGKFGLFLSFFMFNSPKAPEEFPLNLFITVTLLLTVFYFGTCWSSVFLLRAQISVNQMPVKGPHKLRPWTFKPVFGLRSKIDVR
jgi:hypothetical protein